ncbi:hypothetical protein [Massilia sp. Mn16-1_5]|uniref:hypothetical protein n=1 Tax=Massilia sp. Mn16-1_5 TaxID=2079199 RepID=UPI00109E6B33|nr:hypothetical protein [Massilia sp. Mn16-1_5]THC42563.1 hypothetical protein C2862_16200 [Massilia sp. Mn16-1_5]
MNAILNRLYGDYLMPSQLPAYEDLVRAAKQAGFVQTSVRCYHDMVSKGQALPERVMVHRHDIDSDLRTTRKLFELEKKYGIKSSFYFRLCTLDVGLMREIEEYGSEASYHYEELATYAKKNRIRCAEPLRARLPEIRKDFMTNFERIEQRVGIKLRTVAGHGDFANRILKVNNTEILADEELRRRCGIEVESYDRILMEHVDIYIADRPPPQFYHPTSPHKALRGHRRIYLLTHPRQVETNWRANTKENLTRFYENLTW